MKTIIDDLVSLERFIEQAKIEFGPGLHQVVISNAARLKILEKDGINIDKQRIHGITVIAEPFLLTEDVQVVLGQGQPDQ